MVETQSKTTAVSSSAESGGCAPVTVIVIPEPFWPHESECCICGEKLYNCKKGIPMYEGIPVPPDWDKEWGGFDACDKCFDDYESGRLETW